MYFHIWLWEDQEYLVISSVVRGRSATVWRYHFGYISEQESKLFTIQVPCTWWCQMQHCLPGSTGVWWIKQTIVDITCKAWWQKNDQNRNETQQVYLYRSNLAINLKSIVLLFVLLQIILQNRLDSFAPSNLDTRCSLQGRAFPYVWDVSCSVNVQ